MIWPGSRRHQEQRKQLQRKQKCKLWEKEEVMMLVCIYHPMIYGKTVHWVSSYNHSTTLFKNIMTELPL